jgi:predicted nucleotidyltransferase
VVVDGRLREFSDTDLAIVVDIKLAGDIVGASKPLALKSLLDLLLGQGAIFVCIKLRKGHL